VNIIAKIIIKINERSYNLLKTLAKGGRFNRESKEKDGYYYVSIDKEVYDKLMKINDDLDKAIFFLALNEKIRTEL
jgi:hypothetical protein